MAFVVFIAVGTALLWLPISADGPGHIGLEDAMFTSTSAATVTGLGSTDIARFSVFGELVILLLVQVGGFGIMTIGSILALIASHRVGLRQRMLAQAEIGAVDIGDLRRLIVAIAKITVAVEGSLAVILFVRFWQGGYETNIGHAAYSGVFHAITSFNNAGISLYSDNLERFVGDPVVVLGVSGAFIIGGLGFPVLVEFWRRERHRRSGATRPLPWSLHTKITLVATAGLLIVGPLVVTTFEWTNPNTLGPLDTFDKLLAGWFQGVTPRTAGFNTVDIGGMNEPTLLVITTLMFIGAGPASTSGGIKVTTFAVLGYVLWSEARGNRRRQRVPAAAAGQRDPPGAHRRPVVDRPRRGHVTAADEHRGPLALAGAVRGELGVRHGRAVDRRHRQHRCHRAHRADDRDARRARRAGHVRHRTGAARARGDVSLSRGASDHWLTTFFTTCSVDSGPRSSTTARSS